MLESNISSEVVAVDLEWLKLDKCSPKSEPRSELFPKHLSSLGCPGSTRVAWAKVKQESGTSWGEMDALFLTTTAEF